MKEELIKLETAKLAKEKGFNEECDFNYCLEDFVFPTGLEAKRGCLYPFRLGIIRNACAPTQSLLQKWLREEHNIRLYVQQGVSGNFIFNCYTWENPNHIGKWDRYNNIQSYSTYEEALEKGLQEALKLIA